MIGPRRTTFLTASGRVVDVVQPKAEAVDLDDIAASLARQCRFAGHLAEHVEHYSVAQHSVLVSHLCEPENALIGLLHDAAEAYVQDLIRPLKAALPTYRAIEHEWSLAIGFALELEDPAALVNLPDDVKAADELALRIERRDVANVQPLAPERLAELEEWSEIRGLRPFAAQRLFRRRYDELRGIPWAWSPEADP